MVELAKPDARPLVSVVIPTYNRADFVAETIESVLQQTYPNLEILVIDDGSTDDTRAAVAQFVPRVRYVWQENAERGASRNHGLRLAKGEYIAFLDSDDLWLPEMVDTCVGLLEANGDVGLAYADAVQIDKNGRQTRRLRANGPTGKVTDELLKRNFLIMPAHLARTAHVREIGGFREDRQLSGSEDWEMWVRLSLRTRFAYLPQVLAKYRMHSGNTVSNAASMCGSMARAIALVRGAAQLSRHQSKALNRMEASMALVNAINFCSQHEPQQAINFLKAAAAINTRIILDPRYAYTVFRLLRNGLAAG